MPVWLSGFLTAIVVGTLVEYWGHRMMHSWLLRTKHALHHRDGWGQGWLGEFWDYFLGTVPIMAGALPPCYLWGGGPAAGGGGLPPRGGGGSPGGGTPPHPRPKGRPRVLLPPRPAPP